MKPRWWPSPSSFHPTAARSASWSRKELRILETLLGDPKHPYVAVMGGAKVSDKISVIENLIKKVDRLLIGGAMTYTFLKAQGKPVGKSKVEADKLDVASEILHLAGDKLVLPKDHLVASKPEAGAETKVVGGAGDSRRLVRHGHRTGHDRGVLGDHQAGGDRRVERADGKVRGRGVRRGHQGDRRSPGRSPAVTAVGGGESAEAIEKFGLADRVTHVSTGGGAFLESLEGKSFNSLKVIPDRISRDAINTADFLAVHRR